MPTAKPKFEIDLKHLQNNPLSHPHPSIALGGPATPRPVASQSSTSALLSLSQDITALVSLSIEATSSLLNDYVRAALGTIGAGELVRQGPVRRGTSTDSGAGLAVVVVGAADSTGQSLTLRLAKSGYTVFPFVPVSGGPSGIAPSASPLSALLLAWSSVQRRLKSRDPGHTGAVVPVVIDDAGEAFISAHAYTTAPLSPPKRGGRFSDAADTVRAYCRENGLALVSIVSAAPASIRVPSHSIDLPHTLMSPVHKEACIPGLSQSALTRTDEEALMSLYRTYILDPLCVVRALGDLLANPRGDGRTRGRVLFLETSGTLDDLDPLGPPGSGAAQMIAAARTEAARVLRSELSGAGIGVCEIVVGPMAPRLMGPVHLRSSSGDSDTDKALASYNGEKTSMTSTDTALASRLRLLARIFAVDDALVYSCVRRAIEDRYPRARHHAGLAPLITSVANATPGAGIVRFLGRWVLGRLFPPRRAE